MHGNPLVAGFQEDLAQDDEPDRSATNAALHAEPSSDEDAPKTGSQPSPKHKDCLPAEWSLGRSEPQTLESAWRQPAGPVVTVDNEVTGRGVMVRQDVDISDDDIAQACNEQV